MNVTVQVLAETVGLFLPLTFIACAIGVGIIRSIAEHD